MASEKLTRINEFLARHNASIDTISKQKLVQFEKVDDAIQARLIEILKAQEVLRGKPINVSCIASDTGISRKTFYNNDLLRLYVEEYGEAIDDKRALADEVERHKARCEALEREINLLLLRDIEIENLRHENQQLQAEIKNVYDRNANLEEQYEVLRRENAALKEPGSRTAWILQLKK